MKGEREEGRKEEMKGEKREEGRKEEMKGERVEGWKGSK
jgi:hypothetical protein